LRPSPQALTEHDTVDHRIVMSSQVEQRAGRASNPAAEQGFDSNCLPAEPQKDQLLYQLLTTISAQQYRDREAAFQTALLSVEGLKAYQASCLANYKRIVGPMPERTPLNAKVTGKIDRDGFRIERLFFESMPGHRVTGLLYVPDGEGPFRAVLFVLGHDVTGKARESYQRVPSYMAQNGLLVFVVDPVCQGERFQQFETGHGTIGHSLFDYGSRLLGRSTVYYELWDNMRAIDYLATREECDSQNGVGVTGTSGGGTQSLFLGAYDRRTYVASPSCFVETIQTKLEGRMRSGVADGCQHIADEGLYHLDHADYLMMRYPQPTQILAAEHDMFDIRATRYAAKEVEAFYSRMGKKDRFEYFESPTGHGYTPPHQLAGTRWMRKWLLSRSNRLSNDRSIPLLEQEQTYVTKSGQILREYPDERTLADLNLELAMKLAPNRKAFCNRGREEVRKDIRAILRLPQRPPIAPEVKVTTPEEGRFQGCGYEKIIVQREERIPLPAIVMRPADTKNKLLPCTIITDSDGKHTTIGKMRQLASSGRLVIGVDLTGHGETRDQYSGEEKYLNHEHRTAYIAMHIGRSLPSFRVEDMIAVMDYAAKRPDVAEHEKIDLIGMNQTGIIVLHVAVLDDRVGGVETPGGITSWIDDVVAKPTTPGRVPYVIPGVLEYYDIPDLRAMCTQRCDRYSDGVQQ